MSARPITTITVDPDRLHHGVWSDKHSKTIGEGDIAASYSADLIAVHGRVRRPFVHQGVLWACVGMSNHPFECAKAYRLVEAERFAGETTTYAEKTRDGDAARADLFGFYRGVRVTQGGRDYILVGPPAVFIAGEEEQLGLFTD